MNSKSIQTRLKGNKGVSSLEYISAALFFIIGVYFLLLVVSKIFGLNIPFTPSEVFALTENMSLMQLLFFAPGGIVITLIAATVLLAVCMIVILVLIITVQAIMTAIRFIRKTFFGIKVQPKKISSALKVPNDTTYKERTDKRPLIWQGAPEEKSLLVGIREWRIEDANLHSIGVNYIWKSRCETAACKTCESDAPGKDCSCGLYAWDINSIYNRKENSDWISTYSIAIESLLNQKINGVKENRYGYYTNIKGIVVGSGQSQLHFKNDQLAGWRTERQQIICFIDSNIHDVKAEAITEKYDVPFVKNENQIRKIMESLQLLSKEPLPIEEICSQYYNLDRIGEIL